MKPTAKQRIARAVEKFANREQYCVGSDILYREDVVKFVLAERARLKRGVRKVKAFRCYDIQTQDEYQVVKHNDILALWEK